MFLGLIPSALLTPHMGKGQGTGPSPRILSRVSGQATTPDGSNRLAFALNEDFDGFWSLAPAIGGTTAGTIDRFTYYLDTATTASSLASSVTERTGVLALTTGATDNHETWLKSGSCMRLTQAGELGADAVAFEARVNVPLLTSTCFIGLTNPGAVAADAVITDADALANNNAFGFLVNNGALTFVAKRGATATLTLATLTAIAVTGWVKLGFLYDPFDTARLRVFVNNAEVASFTASQFQTGATPLPGQFASASLPFSTTASQVLLQPVFGFKNQAATARTMLLDWCYAVSLL